MKIPRNLSGEKLVKILSKKGYIFLRQKGSHIVLETVLNGTHKVVIPNHNPIKIGTLNDIFIEIAKHFNQSKENLIEELFNKKA
jgi:predicted RNA binding protein YcfA (HicA-like mRNA interferase family)